MSRTRSEPAGGAGAAACPDRPRVWNVPCPAPPVVSREDLLDRLHRALRPADGAGRRPATAGSERRPAAVGSGRRDPAGQAGARGAVLVLVAAQGRGGLGRAHLAAAYAHRHADEYGLVWWVDARTPAGAESCLLDLAAAVAPPAAGPRAAVLRRLWAELGQRSDWLLIYDNVTSPRDLGLAAPPDTGQVIMIAAGPGAARLASRVLPVDVFGRAESVQLLHRCGERITTEDADRLAAALGDHPLAVTQAGHFLAATGMSVPAYLRLLAQHPGWPEPEPEPEDGDGAAPVPGPERRLAAVVSTSRAALAAGSPTGAQLLDGLVFLAAAPLPLTVSARELVRFGLAEACGGAVRVHPLVRELLRAGMPRERRAAALLQARHLVAALGTGRPGDRADAVGGTGEDAADPPLLAVLEQHLRTLVELAASDVGSSDVGSSDVGSSDVGHDPPNDRDEAGLRAVTLRVGRHLRMSGQYGSGRQLVRQERLRWVERLGPDHRDVLDAAELEASILADGCDDPAAARELLADVHHRRVLTSGERHRDTLRTASALARVRGELGDETESARLLEGTLGHQRALFGADDRDALRSADGLGEVLVRLGEYEPARDLLGDTWSRRERTAGAGHPDTWWTAAVLGVALRGLGQARQARVLHERVLTAARERLGGEHPLTLYAVLHLALDLAALKETDAGRDLFTEAIGWDVFGWSGDRWSGDLPPGPQASVIRWAARHRADITALWAGG
ncbi:tetratricopeptide repeat protein [Parafrankia elaeagni]|uniref:tetratricopeptide repeat protein n=1 Tax=Parafrankia elaeagni TaxID=222534 RepID=UPI000377FAC8|nr:tetratricopeptide repeat protein [Parafrankia elaeagni]